MNAASPLPAATFGANTWLVEELYAKYLRDKASVDPAWWDFFADYRPSAERLASRPPHRTPTLSLGSGVTGETATTRTQPSPGPVRGPHRVDPDAPTPVAAASPAKAAYIAEGPERLTHGEEPGHTTALRGAAARAAANMAASLHVPTATSMRPIPAKVLIENRVLINNQLAREHGGRVSFTHLIAFAMAEALREMPSMNTAFGEDDDGKPQVVRRDHVKLGLAVDLTKNDGTRQLVVPGIPEAESLEFAQFWAAYDDVIRRARCNALTVDDLTGVTATLTNPGGIGTAGSVPRLMPDQGVILGVGAMTYPAELRGASDQTVAELAISKQFTLTSTYDHRVIQGAASGEFLALMEAKLTGEDGFFDRVLASLHVPYQPYRWERDRPGGHDLKAARVIRLIHNYRVRGHLMADIDPLSYRQRGHRDLELSSYGLSIWDMDREFATGGFGGVGAQPTMRLRDILGMLRDAYCRKIGIEYMHVEDPDQREWIAQRVEATGQPTPPEAQLHILRRLAEAEALETFLQTKYLGAKRFSLEGGETLIPVLDTLLAAAAEDNYPEVGIGMAHRGRLAVLTLIAGKSYRQVFAEFEDAPDRRSVEGSGDVKYHLGTEGIYTSPQGYSTRVHLAANPSHLEAVDGVLLGIVRAKQDQIGDDQHDTVLPVLIHGDAAFAGQGVVQETLNMSQLQAYRTGGTVHLIINNQIGFTTGTWDSRSTRYATDIAKGFGCPILHVNGDDPEACVAAARLAFDYRATFGRDVVVDIVGYRRRGHNEGDDPSMTQPVMYSLIEHKRSVRKLYTEALLARGDLSVEAAEAALRHFQGELERALTETRRSAPSDDGCPHPPARGATLVRGLEVPHAQDEDAGLMVGWRTAVPSSVLARIGQAHIRAPEGFTVHPKLLRLLARREAMSREGGIDWGFGELAAFGSLLCEGTPVRLAGQDSRRGTFAQRHAVLHDRETGAEWTPLSWLARDQAPFWVYDSSLSEYAPAAFEYGYSVERPEALVVWEAQFGDFFNGAQTVLDEFVASAGQKWSQHSSVVFLLPHGYEGQGPDHSSARIERFLQLCAEDNMVIAQPTTPAQHFHLLRRQAYARPRRPLVVFTPKSMLRRGEAHSQVADLTSGTFTEVIKDSTVTPADVTRVLVCSGKVYWDLMAKRAALGDGHTGIVRVEQLYPLHAPALTAALEGVPTDADVVWCQEEPENQGAWRHMSHVLPHVAGGRLVRGITRPEAASPATGSHATHVQEAAALLDAAFAR
ncbi:MAG: multifunctional oxoglutarate decarboxylase/oxoglutarate dehydrogenase thiamine pyrophosphate-binding subunit/dihydrolipoyllysine-residue succinyltransferase subunit [Bifidobacteriaceae bacterium]|nr:multifunctional oxoglutarate decarboxylase/oxoglutarate dehydrogenase thiamine pyrophosphate-binding subunit/dihydrolipoyllysine-residue succinyltransferase subunit [Bifidobacteriaceae bacterium]